MKQSFDYDQFVKKRKFYYRCSEGDTHKVLLPFSVTWQAALNACALAHARMGKKGYVRVMLEVAFSRKKLLDKPKLPEDNR